jgi:subtilisin-like proprotein convertase family protein
MKLPTWIMLSCLSASMLAPASVVVGPFTSGFANSGNVPDGNTVGWSDTRTVSGIAETRITDVSVTLNIAGGFNGDLYAYLSHDGVLVPLLNRAGVTATDPTSAFGYSDAGYNITLSSSAGNDVHFYNRYSPAMSGGQLTGSWQPDGRAIDPLLAAASFDAASRTSLGAFNTHDPNGHWTLFIADLSTGGGQSQVASWQMDITAVPEPGQWGLAMGLAALISCWWRKRSVD